MAKRDNQSIVSVIAAYRSALRRADWAAIKATTDVRGRTLSEHGAHPILERSSVTGRANMLDAIETYEREALRAELPQLARKWRDADSHVVAVRWIRDTEAEAYESVTLQGETFELVTHLIHDGRWRVRGSSVATDREVEVLLPYRDDVQLVPTTFDDRFLDDWGERASLAGTDTGFVVTADRGVTVHGRFGAPREGLREWPGVSAETGAVLDAHRGCIELTLELQDALEQRIAQLETLAMVAATLARGHADRIVLRDVCKVYTQDRFERATRRARASLTALVSMWLDVVYADGVLFTLGLSRFGRPELEVRGEFDAESDAAAILARLAVVCAVDDIDWQPGDTLRVDGKPAYHVHDGRRGPTYVWSYGRFGAVELEPASHSGSNAE